MTREFKVTGREVRLQVRQHRRRTFCDTVRPLRMAQEQLDVRTSIVDFRIDTVEVTAYGKKETKRYATMNAQIFLVCPGTLDSCNATGETQEKPSMWPVEHEWNGPQTAEAMVAYLEKMFLRARFQISYRRRYRAGAGIGEQSGSAAANNLIGLRRRSSRRRN